MFLLQVAVADAGAVPALLEVLQKGIAEEFATGVLRKLAVVSKVKVAILALYEG